MEKAEIISIGLKALLCVIAMILYAAWKVRGHLRNFNIRIFINANKNFWIWTMTMMALVLTIVTVHPPAASAIKSMIGLDVNGEPTSFLLLGWGLSALVNKLNPKKIDKKKPV